MPYDPTDRGYAHLAEGFSQEGFLTCIFNFRGAGESEGNLDLLGWTRDLGAVIDHVSGLPEVDATRIFVMGFSGGAAAATYVTAHDERVTALVLCACPAEFAIPDSEKNLRSFWRQCCQTGTIRDADFPSSLEEWGDHFRQVSPIDWIANISPRPLLIIHGDRDEVVDLDHARRLYEQAGDPKELVIIPDGEHRLRTNEAAMNIALAWLETQSHDRRSGPIRSRSKMV